MALRIIRSSRNFLAASGQLCRAPKKKGQAEAKIESDDIVNIFKGKTDPPLRPIRFYPAYVQEYMRDKPSVGEHNMMIQWGIPEATLMPTERNRYLKGLKKLQVKNKKYHMKELIKVKIDEESDHDMYERWFLDDPTDIADDDTPEEEEQEQEEDDEEEQGGKPQGRRREQ